MAICFFACEDNELEKNQEVGDYLIFGRYFGNCVDGQCIEIYKWQNNNLYAAKRGYPTFAILQSEGSFEADFSAIQNLEEFNIEELVDNFPDELLNEESIDIGCPDCYDQGGYFFELRTDTIQDNWRVDRNKNSVPSYLIPYLELVDEKIDLIGQQ